MTRRSCHDRVAQARAELEKGNARMLLGIREALTAEQWNRLQMQSGTAKASLKEQKLAVKKKLKQ